MFLNSKSSILKALKSNIYNITNLKSNNKSTEYIYIDIFIFSYNFHLNITFIISKAYVFE